AMQMIAGGLLLVVASALLGELGAVNVGSFTWKAVAAWAYLIVFGSLAGFTAYTWLLRVSTPARVATTAYVNPVVAVILGWTIASEPLTMRVGVAVVAIVIAVIAMTRK
ncbi:MAG TPA: EamA family transporter, partial [Longimicrobiales bacterium]|nr:EamA family transporter [Longimicrobiales bacterium]